MSLALESKVDVLGDLNRHVALVALNDRIHLEDSRAAEWLRRTKPNKRFDPSGISLDFIVNLAVAQLSPAGSTAALDTLRIKGKQNLARRGSESKYSIE